MKKWMIVSILSVVFACGIFVYTEWVNRRFVDALPKPPTVEQQSVDTPLHPHEHPHPHEDPVPATPSNANVFDTQTILIENSTSPEPSEEDTAQVETDSVEESTPAWLTDDEHEHEHKSTKDPFGAELIDLNQGEEPIDLDQMDPDEYADMIRVGLLEQFGDIPDVHTFVELTRKIKKQETLSLDERIDFTRAQYALWPDVRTQETLEIFLEEKASRKTQ